MVAPCIDRSQVAISRRRVMTGVAGLTFAIALEQVGVSNAAERNAEPRQEGFELSTIAQDADQSDSADLGRMARQAVIEIFRDRDPTAVDRFFSQSFVQHDPNLADGHPV